MQPTHGVAPATFLLAWPYHAVHLDTFAKNGMHYANELLNDRLGIYYHPPGSLVSHVTYFKATISRLAERETVPSQIFVDGMK